MKRKPKADVDAAAFRDFLMRQTPSFDKVFLDDADWAGGWTGTVHTEPWDKEQWLDDRYFETMRAVRRLSEGPSYQPWNEMRTFKQSALDKTMDALHKFFEDWPK